MQAEPSDIRAKTRLALEIRSQRFSFTVLEGTHLLDWGGCVCSAGSSQLSTALRKLGILLSSYNPAIVIWRDPRSMKGPHTQLAMRIAKAFRNELTQRSVPQAVIARSKIAELFNQLGCRNKYQIAMYLANKFAPLQPYCPPKRKTWEAERYMAAVFDAAASAEAFNSRPEQYPS